MGFDVERRDSITLSSLPFSNNEVLEAPVIATPWYDLKELSKNGIRNGLISLVVLMFFFLVLRPFLKWTVAADEKLGSEGSSGMFPRTVSELESAAESASLPL